MPKHAAVKRIAAFGAYEFDLRSRELRKHGLKLRLEEKPGQILGLLIGRRGQLVTREELKETLWPEGIHLDFNHGLNKSMSKLRAALGDEKESPNYIETLSRRGYRFLAEVEIRESEIPGGEEDEEESGTGETEIGVEEEVRGPVWERSAGKGAWRKWAVLLALVSVAGLLFASLQLGLGGKRGAAGSVEVVVLPFENLTGDANQEYLCDGSTEEMIAQLNSLGPEKVRVIARRSAMHYKGTKKTAKEIGEELGATYVLESTVRKQGDVYRVTTELIDAKTETHVWSGSFDREFKNILDVHREVTLGIAGEIRTQVPVQAETPALGKEGIQPLAHEHYLRGLYAWNRRTVTSLREAIDEYREAIAIEPEYPEAFAGLADAYSMLASFGGVPYREGYPKARAAAEKALKMDGESAEAEAALAFVEAYYDWNFAGAEQDFQRALRMNANSSRAHHWYGLFLSETGREEKAIVELRLAQRLDPKSLAVTNDLGMAYMEAGRYEKAEAMIGKARQIDPEHFGSYQGMATLYAREHRFAEAKAENETFKKLSGVYVGVDNILAYEYAKTGQGEKARKKIAEMAEKAKQHGDDPLCPLDAYLALGEKEKALECLKKAVEARADWMVVLEGDPELETMKRDGRFETVMRGAGYPLSLMEN